MSAIMEEKSHSSPTQTEEDLYKWKEWEEAKDELIESIISDFDLQNLIYFLPLEKVSNKKAESLFQYLLSNIRTQMKSKLHVKSQPILHFK